MSYSALGELQPQAKKVWAKAVVNSFFEHSELMKYTGTDENSIVMLVTELTETEKGDRAGFALVADLQQSGVTGDNQLEGREEALDSSWCEIQIDQLRHGTSSKGRMDNQKSVINFRVQSKEKLARWRANIVDQLMISTVSGISYSLKMDGSPRALSDQDQLLSLQFADLVTPPSSGRHFIVDGNGNFVAGDTSGIAQASVLSYKVLVDAKAEAVSRGIKPFMAGGRGYHLFLCHPKAYAQLQKDADFKNALVNALPRSENNPIFTGAVVTMDGLVIATSLRVFNTSGAAAGSKWGSNGNVNGTRSLLLGAQALGMADLWDKGIWFEGKKDHDNKSMISLALMFGFVKPQFKSDFDNGTVQDFGSMVIDHYIAP